MDIVKRLRLDRPCISDVDCCGDICIEAADEIERLRNVVALLIEYEEHDENILKGAVMWESLIEAAHRALMEKQS
jgi:hypothetical protein